MTTFRRIWYATGLLLLLAAIITQCGCAPASWNLQQQRPVTTAVVTCTWTAPTDGGPVEEYVVEVKPVNGEWEEVRVTSLTRAKFRLAVNRWYVARVAGRNEHGQGPWSEESEPHFVIGPEDPDIHIHEVPIR